MEMNYPLSMKVVAIFLCQMTRKRLIDTPTAS
jgi:hypothetical protein